MATEIITGFGQQCDSNGVPMSGALIYVYDVGTTTLKSVYSDTGLSVSAANPIVCDSAGRHDMRYIATGSYKIVVKTSASVSVYTRDNIDGRIPVGSGALAVANGGTGATTEAGALAILGAATAAELADVTAEVASLSGTLASTEKTHVATGTTAQRTGSPAFGDIRANSTTTEYEGYISGGWDNFMFESGNAAATADVTAETAAATFIRPDRLKYSQRVAIAWARVTISGGTPSLTNGFGFSSSITDNGAGDYTLTFTDTQPNANYSVIATGGGSNEAIMQIFNATTTAIRIKAVRRADGIADDPVHFNVIVFGDYA